MNTISDQLLEKAVKQMMVEEDKKVLEAIGVPIEPEVVQVAKAVIAHGSPEEWKNFYEQQMQMWGDAAAANHKRLNPEKTAVDKLLDRINAGSRVYDLIKSDLELYGTCYLLKVVPFKREFRCMQCRTVFGSIRSFERAAYVFSCSRFEGRCANCGDPESRVDIVDKPSDGEDNRQICLDPAAVTCSVAGLLWWKIPDVLKTRIHGADPVALAFTPMHVLAAVMAGRSSVAFTASSLKQFTLDPSPVQPGTPVVQSARDSYRDIAKKTGLSQ